jgi:hypothetical protein
MLFTQSDPNPSVVKKRPASSGAPEVPFGCHCYTSNCLSAFYIERGITCCMPRSAGHRPSTVLLLDHQLGFPAASYSLDLGLHNAESAAAHPRSVQGSTAGVDPAASTAAADAGIPAALELCTTQQQQQQQLEPWEGFRTSGFGRISLSGFSPFSGLESSPEPTAAAAAAAAAAAEAAELGWHKQCLDLDVSGPHQSHQMFSGQKRRASQLELPLCGHVSAAAAAAGSNWGAGAGFWPHSSEGGFSSSTHECMLQRHEQMQVMQAGGSATAGRGSHFGSGRHYSDACSALPDSLNALPTHPAAHMPGRIAEWTAPQQLQQPQLVPQQEQKQKLPAHLAAKRFCLDLSDEALQSTAAAAAHGSS